jgi:hypothetical protein
VATVQEVYDKSIAHELQMREEGESAVAELPLRASFVRRGIMIQEQQYALDSF